MDSIRQFNQNIWVQFVPITSLVRNEAIQLYAERHDKRWGLVDCSSFIIMKQNNITAAFTNDRHYIQAGFECLLAAD